MERFIAIDSGKFATKVAEYNKAKNGIICFSTRSKVSEGDFRDDALEDNTFIIDPGDGHAYKVGNGAKGQGVELETNKMTDMHKICMLNALGMLASSNEKDEINVAIGLPALEWANISKREDFKEYMLPEGDITVRIKRNSKEPPVTKTFTIKNRYVFPESEGAIFADGIIDTISPTTITGVIDIGNLNLNATLWQGSDLIQDMSATAELGGALLIQELSQELSGIVPCNTLITANILKSSDRVLPESPKLTEEQREKSRKLIKKVLRQHADKVKRICLTKNWSLDVTNVIAIGGTSEDIKDELKECFGNITFIDNPQFCNVFGYLRMMCAKDENIGDIIPLTMVKREAKAGNSSPIEKDTAKK